MFEIITKFQKKAQCPPLGFPSTVYVNRVNCESEVGKINIHRERQEWRVFVASAERAVVRTGLMLLSCHTCVIREKAPVAFWRSSVVSLL